MGIFKRVGKLITADIHGMLDLLEDPVDICKQAIREMEEEIALIKEGIQAKSTRIEKLEEQLKRIAEKHTSINEQLNLCVQNGDEVLARNVLKRKLEQEKLTRFLEQQRQTAVAEREREQKQGTEYEERLNSVREKLTCLSDREPYQKRTAEGLNESLQVSDEEIELAFLKIKSAQTGKSAQAAK